jgi:membrane protein implicated in regulation of membrane protease activity
MLIVVTLLAILIAVSAFLCWMFDDAMNWVYFLALSLVVTGAIALITLCIMWPVSYYSMKQDIAVYQTTKQTIEDARKNGASDIERAALTTKIIEINESLARAKYQNHTWLDLTIPDEYAALPYLK